MTTQAFLHIHHRETDSRSNGPGLRAVIWTQGCSLGCPGCFNPETHPVQTGQSISIEELTAWCLAQPASCDGLTISGGEPFQQSQALAALLCFIRKKSTLPTIVFTGYTQNELARIPFAPDALAHIDLLISGRYNHAQRVASGLIGSANKTFHFLTNRYTLADLRSVPEAEIWIKPDGSVSFSGINPLQW